MENILLHGSELMGLSLSKDAISAFHAYYEMLEEKNKVVNLTSITGEKDITELHFLDSLSIMRFFDLKNAKIIDIGSGAGFPGLPLKIAEPSIKLTLLDSNNKKIDFLEELCRSIDLGDVICLHARAEEVSFTRESRDAYDYAVSRAVSRLNILCELCMPFVKIGGAFIALKSVSSDEEIDEAKNAIEILGGRLEEPLEYELPGNNIKHRLVVIRKIKKTPEGYPRRFVKIQKKPL